MVYILGLLLRFTWINFSGYMKPSITDARGIVKV